MTIVAYALFAVLASIATVHFYWAAGGVWPAPNERSLARTVFGVRNIATMPSRGMTVAVAAGIFLAAIWPLLAARLVVIGLPAWLIAAGAVGLAAVFLARGCAGVLPLMRRRFPEEPFATLNRWIYSPLCLAIGAGFLVLFLNVR